MKSIIKVLVKVIFLFFLLISSIAVNALDNLPIGNLEYVSTTSGSGWAYDADAGTNPIKVHVYIDGRFYQEVPANLSRPDLVSDGNIPDPNHGFTFNITGIDLTRVHEVMVYAINYGGGANPQIAGSPSTTATPPSGNSTITAVAGVSSIKITTSQRVAGAIQSLTWNGKEFIDKADHGRELQSAVTYNGLQECFNPTEAGSEFDAAGSTSSSLLQYIKASGNILETQILPAFWAKPGSATATCSTGAVNTTLRSAQYFHKKVTIGMSGMNHVIKYDTQVDIPDGESYSSAQFEVLTGYMPLTFSVFRTYDPSIAQLLPISVGPGEQSLPLIFSTTDDKYAMGIYSPDLPYPNQPYPSSGYGRFSFPESNCVKWNQVYRQNNVPAGSYKFHSYVIVGTLSDVTTSMDQLYNYFKISALDFTANTVEFGNPTTITVSATDSNPDTKYQWDLNNDGKVDTTTTGNLTYKFPKSGSIAVRLTAVNGAAAVHQKEVVKNIEVNPTKDQLTLYVYKTGAVAFQDSLAAIDSIVFVDLSNYTVSDYDGNMYHQVTIGTNIWMVENYKCTHYSDGTVITSFKYPGDNVANKYYGGYYAWNDIVKPNFAPAGWHVATNQEWTNLWNTVAHVSNPIKEAGTAHWNTANGTNETGFTALGSGNYYSVSLNSYATWWTSSPATNAANGIRWYIEDTPLTNFSWTDGNGKDMIFSVRLVKD